MFGSFFPLWQSESTQKLGFGSSSTFGTHFGPGHNYSMYNIGPKKQFDSYIK